MNVEWITSQHFFGLSVALVSDVLINDHLDLLLETDQLSFNPYPPNPFSLPN